MRPLFFDKECQVKLETDIKLRRDGTVKAAVPGGTKYEFKPDEFGDVVCDVADDADVAYLLNTGYFYPADEDDIDVGLAAVAEEGDEENDSPSPPIETPKKRTRRAGK